VRSLARSPPLPRQSFDSRTGPVPAFPSGSINPCESNHISSLNPVLVFFFCIFPPDATACYRTLRFCPSHGLVILPHSGNHKPSPRRVFPENVFASRCLLFSSPAQPRVPPVMNGPPGANPTEPRYPLSLPSFFLRPPKRISFFWGWVCGVRVLCGSFFLFPLFPARLYVCEPLCFIVSKATF